MQMIATKRRRRDISVAHDVSRGLGAQDRVGALGEGDRISAGVIMQGELLSPSPRA